MLLKNIAPIGQRDPKWKDKKLGTSSVSIGDAGCVLCCATIISRFYGHDVWPDWLNEQMVKVNGYYDTNLWQWHKLTEIFPDIKVHKLIDCYTTPAPLNEIDKRLEEGHPVIVCVDFDPKPGVQTHYVVIFGKEGDDYYLADPWFNDVALFKGRYGDPAKAIYAIRMYDRPLSPAPAPDPCADLRTKCEELEKENQRLTKELKTSQEIQQQTAASLSEISSQLAQKTKEVEKWQEELASCKDELAKKEETIANLERRISSRDNRIAELEKERTDYRGYYEKALERDISKMSYGQILVVVLKRLFNKK
jgi:hypothetical protein